MPNSSEIPKYAVIGMEASVGRWSALDQVASALFFCQQAFDFDAGENSWRPQATQMEIDLQKLGLSPDELDQAGAVRLAALQVALGALQDASLNPEDALPPCGVIAAAAPGDSDLAGWISSHLGLDGPTFSSGGELDWVMRGLGEADRWISTGEAELVLLVGLNAPPQSLAGSGGSGPNPPSLGFERGMDRQIERSGAAALVLQPLAGELESGVRVYAAIEGRAEGLEPSAGAGLASAYEASGHAAGNLEVLVSAADGSAVWDEAERALAAGALGPLLQASSCAVVGTAANFGSLGPAAPLMSLLQASLLLYHRFVSGLPGWNGPKNSAAWENLPFYFPYDSRPWFARPGKQGRLAGVNLRAPSGKFAHLILARKDEEEIRENPFLSNAAARLVPLAGDQLEDLITQLDRLRDGIAAGQDLGSITRTAFQEFRDQSGRRLALALIASSREDLAREIEFARKGLPKAVERDMEWQTPSGSYFTPSPVGGQSGVAFVYPGAFNSFPGLGKDLFQLFPKIYPEFTSLSQNIGEVFRERALYPRRITAPNQKELEELEAGLSRDPIAMLTSGSSLAVAYTAVLRKVFGVHPQAAFGYSLGETSMLFSMRVWVDGDEGSSGLMNSPVFKSRLSGRQDTIREAWGVDSQAGLAADEPLWTNLLIMAPPEVVREAIAGEERVYLTHINTPRQVVIAGYPPAVRRVAARINAPSLQAPFDHALHCDPVRIEFDRLAALHDLPVTVNHETTLYTAASYAPVRQEQKEISRDIAEALCSCLDFPRLINQVYADGARVFIEVGAGSNCSRWIDETLKGSPHLAVSVSRKGSDDLSAVLRTLARLLCHRVGVDLSPLYARSGEEASPYSLSRKIQLDQVN